MTESIEAITTATLRLALDAASLRQRAIAANIANHATEGYVPQKVNFESQLAQARLSLETQGRVDSLTLSDVRLRLEPALDAHGSPAKVHLDQQVADMAENSVQFQALARGLSRHLAILSTAVADGKR